MIEYLKKFACIFRRFNPNDFVWVNIDGSVRELNSSELEYLSNPTGEWPHYKSELTSNFDGDFSGYIERSKIPSEVEIGPPVEHESYTVEDFVEAHEAAGDIVTETDEGYSIEVDPSNCPEEKNQNLNDFLIGQEKSKRKDLD